MKSNIIDVNKALDDMHERVESRVLVHDFTKHLVEQQKVTQTLIAENCSARWMWHSGNLNSNGFAVPWEVQSVNSFPDNFVWNSQDNSNVTTVAPGLYEITLGFFNAKKPTVQVLVNGQTIISAVQQS